MSAFSRQESLRFFDGGKAGIKHRCGVLSFAGFSEREISQAGSRGEDGVLCCYRDGFYGGFEEVDL